MPITLSLCPEKYNHTPHSDILVSYRPYVQGHFKKFIGGAGIWPVACIGVPVIDSVLAPLSISSFIIMCCTWEESDDGIPATNRRSRVGSSF